MLALKNAHLRSVNYAFSGFASLKIALFIQSPKNEGDFWVTLMYYSYSPLSANSIR